MVLDRTRRVLHFSLVSQRKWRSLTVALLFGLVASRAHATETTRYFAYADERYLFPGQHRGGAALVPDDVPAGVAVPLVVFLHGTNSTGETHLWLGGGGHDLRPLAIRLMKERTTQPFVLAAPSQTKGAAGTRNLWSEFDLGKFVDDVAAATEGELQIDRARVVVAGHSGAGCNAAGGLATDFWTGSKQLPMALVSIDPCLDAEMGEAFSKRPAAVPLLLWWQSAIWPRSPADFWSALVADKPKERIDRMTVLPPGGPNPHDAIVPVAFERMVGELFQVERE
jgi:acetyl esterase/lipase